MSHRECCSMKAKRVASDGTFFEEIVRRMRDTPRLCDVTCLQIDRSPDTECCACSTTRMVSVDWVGGEGGEGAEGSRPGRQTKQNKTAAAQQ